jgi:hypothetical protein
MLFPKPKRVGDKKLLAKVRLQPCRACHRPGPNHAHHVSTKGAHGGDIKENIMPLCAVHHTEWHKSGPGTMIRKYPGVVSWLEQMKRDDILENPLLL